MAMPATWMKITLQLSSPQRFKFYNVFYYVPVDSPSFTSSPMADALTIGSTIDGSLITNLPACLTTSTFIVGAAYEMHTGGQVYETSNVNGTAGTVMGDELADFEAVVIQKRTATAGKSGRGRWFLGPIPETMTDEDFVDVGAAAAFNLVALDWMSSPTALGTAWKPQLFSKKNQTLMEITSTYVDVKIGSIRGRKSHSILT